MKNIDLNTTKLLIGMIHLPPLPGFKGHQSMQQVIDFAADELEKLEEAGFDGALVENENDKPHLVESPPQVTAAMTLVMQALTASAAIPVGCEILLNDPQASLAAARLGGGSFIRTDYFVDRMSRPEHGGEMKIDPEGLIAYQKKIGAEKISLLTDVQVKYATLLEQNKSIKVSVKQAFAAGSSGVVVSGNFTGEEPDLKTLQQAYEAAAGKPVLVGSGFSESNALKLIPFCTGAIVGTSIKTGDAVNLRLAKSLADTVRKSVA